MTQTCNVGGEERTFDMINISGTRPPVPHEVGQQGGWRELQVGVHICPDCIEKILQAN